MFITKRFFLLSGLFLATVTSVGCQKNEGTAPSQTVARAAGTEITIHELRHGLAGVKTTPELEKRALESLVDQTILAKKAVEDGLEKDPAVAMTLAAARRSLLAQAYTEKIAGKGAVPTEVELKAYYDKAPHLFGQRRVYAFRDVGIPTSIASMEQVQAALKNVKSIEQFRDSMGAAVKAIPIRQRVSPAEELPVEISEAFVKIKKGGLGLIAMKGQSQVLQVIDIQDAPVGFAVAKPTIQRLMMEQSKRARLEQLVIATRKEAAIEYLGDFALDGAVAKASTAVIQPPAPIAGGASEASPSRTAKAEPEGVKRVEKSSTPTQSATDRGVAAMR